MVRGMGVVLVVLGSVVCCWSCWQNSVVLVTVVMTQGLSQYCVACSGLMTKRVYCGTLVLIIVVLFPFLRMC